MFRIFILFLINLCFVQMMFAGQKGPITIGVIQESHKTHPAMASSNDAVSFFLKPLFKKNKQDLLQCVQCKDHSLTYQSKSGVLNAKFTLGKYFWDNQAPVRCDDYYLSYSIIKYHLANHPQKKYWQNIIMKPCDPLFPNKIHLKIRGRRWSLFNLLFYPTPSTQEKKTWDINKEKYLQTSKYLEFKKHYKKNKGLYPDSDQTFQFRSFNDVLSMISALLQSAISQTQAFSTKNLPRYTLEELKQTKIGITEHHAHEHLTIGFNHRNQAIRNKDILSIYHQVYISAQKTVSENPLFFEKSHFTDLMKTPAAGRSNQRFHLLISNSSRIKKNFFYLPNIQKNLLIQELDSSDFLKTTSEIRYKDFTAYITKIEPWNELAGLAASRFTPTYLNDYRGSNIHAIQSVGFENILDSFLKIWELKKTQKRLLKARKTFVNDLKIYPFLAFKTISAHRK